MSATRASSTAMRTQYQTAWRVTRASATARVMSRTAVPSRTHPTHG